MALLFANAGFCSIVAAMNPLNAANRFAAQLDCGGAFAVFSTTSSIIVVVACAFVSVPVVFIVVFLSAAAISRTVESWARLLPNLSISPLTTRSFFFSAPGLLRKLLCLTLPSFSASPPRTSSFVNSGNASAKLSRLVWSFFLSWRFAFFRAALEIPLLDLGWAILETNAECLIRRLSRLESRKVSSTTASGRWTLRGARGLARRSVALRRRVLRLEGATGAFVWIDHLKLAVQVCDLGVIGK